MLATTDVSQANSNLMYFLNSGSCRSVQEKSLITENWFQSNKDIYRTLYSTNWTNLYNQKSLLTAKMVTVQRFSKIQDLEHSTKYGDILA